MQPSTLLLALASSASAASIARQASHPSFAVSGLSISSIYYEQTASYSLSVEYGDASANCSLTQEQAPLGNKFCDPSKNILAPRITGFSDAACSNPAFTWSVVARDEAAGDYTVETHYKVSDEVTVTGCHQLQGSDFACYTQGDTHAQDEQVYSGATAFTEVYVADGTCATK